MVVLQIGQNLSGVVGSPAYVAPEVLLGDYSEKVDVWSAGILLHALLVGFLPFQGDSLKTVFEAIKKENLDFKGGVWESISQSARDLMRRMLMRDVSMRFTAAEVLSEYLNPQSSIEFQYTVKRINEGEQSYSFGIRKRILEYLMYKLYRITCTHTWNTETTGSTI